MAHKFSARDVSHNSTQRSVLFCTHRIHMTSPILGYQLMRPHIGLVSGSDNTPASKPTVQNGRAWYQTHVRVRMVYGYMNRWTNCQFECCRMPADCIVWG